MDSQIETLASGLSTMNLTTMNLSAMSQKDNCQVVWHYAEMSISPDSFTRNIDWINQVIKLKYGQTSVFITFTYFTGFRRVISLNNIIDSQISQEGAAGLPRIQIIKEWGISDLGLSTIFKDSETNGLTPGNYLVVPILDNSNEIHMCIIGLARHKLGYMLKVGQTLLQRFTMFIDLADGFRNHLSITGVVQATGVNIFKAIFELLKKRPIIDYLDLLANLPPIPFIQMVYNIIAYFPELQVVWSAEPNEKTHKKIMEIDSVPFDRVLYKYGWEKQLEKLHTKWLGKRENSSLCAGKRENSAAFKSMIGAIHSHSQFSNLANQSSSGNPTKASHKPNEKQPARFSALWPEVMDVVVD